MDGSFLVVNICACARMLLLYISSLPEAPLDSRFFFSPFHLLHDSDKAWTAFTLHYKSDIFGLN